MEGRVPMPRISSRRGFGRSRLLFPGNSLQHPRLNAHGQESGADQPFLILPELDEWGEGRIGLHCEQ
jgi:hypothetical protein